MNTPILDKVIEQLKTLPNALQWRVLEFMRSLEHPNLEGVPGRQLLRFAGTIPIDDTKVIDETVKEGCQRVDGDEW